MALMVAVALAGCRTSTEPATTSLLFTEAQVQRADMAQVVQAFGQVSALQDRFLTYETVGGRLLEVLVQVGQQVHEGDAIAQLDTAPLERQLLEAEADLDVAEAVLREAEADASPAMILQAEADLLAAQYELAKAEMDVHLSAASGSSRLEQEVADRRYDLQAAQDQAAVADLTAQAGQIRQLEYDQAFFQRALRDLAPDQNRGEIEENLADAERALSAARIARESSLRAARDAVRKAQEELQKASAKLARSREEGYDPQAEARLAYEEAVARVEKAAKRAEQVHKGPDPTVLEAAQTGYDAALAKVESVLASLEASTLRAPFDGVIFDLRTTTGQIVSPSDQIAYLVAPDALRLESAVSEVDVVRLQVGQPVRITLEAYPDRMLEGEVLEISPRGQSQGGLTMFKVRVSLDRGGLDIRPGMTAMLKMVVGEERNVLVVPSAALRQSPNGGVMVQVLSPSNDWVDRDIKIGTNDGILAEVLTGVEEGETLRYPLQEPAKGSPYDMPFARPGPTPAEGGEQAPPEEQSPSEDQDPSEDPATPPDEATELVPGKEGEQVQPPTDGAGQPAPLPMESQPSVVSTPAPGGPTDDGSRGK